MTSEPGMPDRIIRGQCDQLGIGGDVLLSATFEPRDAACVPAQ